MLSTAAAGQPVYPLGSRAGLTGGARRFDLAVIGGGINGAGIARAAALAGLSVCLLEKYDFGWGTTWRSTKLIHGGLRYLEHAEFGLVFESLRDQALLLRDYPEMVRPLSLLLPVYRGARHGAAAIGLGLVLYDLLARGRQLPGHHRFNARTAVSLEPGLRAEGLRAVFQYSDSQVAYPERLCIQTLIEAASAGAICLNRAEVRAVLRVGDRAAGVRVHDALLHRDFEIQSRVVVNAAGPWIDHLLGTLDRPPRRQLGGTRGAHLVVDYDGQGPTHALYAEARSDRRPFFIIPWRGRHLIGTTDTRFDGAPETARATRADVEYLLSEANALLPRTPIGIDAVQYAYAGVRPLPASDGVAEGAITRRHLIREHGEAGYRGLFSVIGGKLSTYRSLADDVLRRIARCAQPPAPPAPTHGANYRAGGDAAAWEATRWLLDLVGPATGDHLRSLYGPRLPRLARLVSAEPRMLKPLCPHGPDILGQALLAAREEGAQSVADVLLRRVGAGWNACLGRDGVAPVAALLAAELKWTPRRADQAAGEYIAEARATFLTPGGNPPAPSAPPEAG
ncbi:MAG TPA: glycerol-3-phosphate dehydrogenase/oxidase [Dehalococcoidia bacterium]|nr:glycerol-3-phosphate dehydrogenase/oxidase [Dehalococcoidia bacterium]